MARIQILRQSQKSPLNQHAQTNGLGMWFSAQPGSHARQRQLSKARCVARTLCERFKTGKACASCSGCNACIRRLFPNLGGSTQPLTTITKAGIAMPTVVAPCEPHLTARGLPTCGEPPPTLGAAGHRCEAVDQQFYDGMVALREL